MKPTPKKYTRFVVKKTHTGNVNDIFTIVNKYHCCFINVYKLLISSKVCAEHYIAL